ncbi:hypothetical protein [Nesterenkonia lutea]|uniref:DUF4230 domain-containing protein n=1 Tax=Nesterenkonia lutea TaxID=272919 RepID=A0ABR9JC69_9MICC|nr:hypothetical protein [Nesterenkonia lutea]MBE1523532.1 hypothetical protein [Nesterenkonia lutea]
MKRLLLSGLGVLLAVVVIVLLVPLGSVAKNSLFGAATDSRDTRIITAVERQEQIVLLSTSTQGLTEEKSSSTLFGQDLPGTGRTQFLQYTYRAKLGIEGNEVSIEETGENQYLVSVPEFMFIGHDDVDFKTAIDDNGVLSWVTPEIDTASKITEILGEDEMAEQISSNSDLLQDQARVFYTGVIQGIDKDVEIDFEFSGVE